MPHGNITDARHEPFANREIHRHSKPVEHRCDTNGQRLAGRRRSIQPVSRSTLSEGQAPDRNGLTPLVGSRS
jgi:hypothetical protein